MIFHQIKKFTNNIAFIDNKKNKIKYYEITELKKKLESHIKQKSLTMIISENTAGSLMGYSALSMLDVLLMPISDDISNERFEKLLSKYCPNFLWCKKNFNKQITSKFFEILLEYQNYVLLRSKKEKKIRINSNLFILLSTSGSIGDPKCVKLSYQNVIKNSHSINKYLNLNFNDRTVTTMPWHYSYGMSIINTHIMNGASILVSDNSIVEKNFWDLLNEISITNFNGVPFTYEILKKIGINKLKKLNLKFITQAGGKMNSSLSDELTVICKINKIKFFVMYGQTEASPRMSFTDKTLKKTDSTCIGKPIHGGKFFLFKNKKKINKINTIGELYFKGDNVFSGYSKNHKDLFDKKIYSKLLNTGDLAKFDKNGNYYLVGRKSRFIKIYGIRIGLDSIEDNLLENGILSAVISKNEKLFIFIKKRISEKIKKKISEIIKIRFKDFNLIKINEFPMNENNKVSYSKLSNYCIND